jgi:hypothetical protein
MARTAAWVVATAVASGALGAVLASRGGGGEEPGLAERVARLEAENADLRRAAGAAAPPAAASDAEARAPAPSPVGSRDRPAAPVLAAGAPRPDRDDASGGALVVESLTRGLRHAIEAKDLAEIEAYRLALVARGLDSAPAMLAIAADPEAPVALRATAFDVLRRIDAPGRLEPALAALDAPDEALRLTALAAAVSAAGDAAATLPPVRDALSPSLPLDALQRALDVTFEAHEPAAYATLAALLRHDEEARRAQGIAGALRIRHAAGAGFLRKALEAPDLSDDERASLAQALSRTKGPSWSAAQATGEPDTATHGDHASAWAHKRPEMGPVTLTLEFEREVRPDAVRVHETYNPGAVVRVEGVRAGGAAEVLWEGAASAAGSQARWFAPPLVAGASPVRVVRLVLDTDAVPGWNEIDAVELVGDGARQWARAATASSSYSDP